MSICCSCLSDRFPDDGGACVCQAGLPAANRIPGVRFRNPRCRPRKTAFSHDIAWRKHARPARLTSRHELNLSATFQEWGPRFRISLAPAASWRKEETFPDATSVCKQFLNHSHGHANNKTICRHAARKRAWASPAPDEAMAHGNLYNIVDL